MGEIRMFGGNFAPLYWQFCDGRSMSIAENTALFSLLGTTYGGDGQVTFNLPDLRGRVPLGTGQGPGLQFVDLGEMGGSETHTLVLAEMPGHTHSAQVTSNASIMVSSAQGTSSVPAAGGSIAAMVTGSGRTATPVNAFNGVAPNTSLNSLSAVVTGNMQVASVGAGQPHTNIQPSIALQYIICVEGIYPSRN